MLRLLLIFLLLANALALAGVLGWLGGTPRPTEPERVSNQIQPERILLAAEAPPPAAAPAETIPEPADALPQAEEPSSTQPDAAAAPPPEPAQADAATDPGTASMSETATEPVPPATAGPDSANAKVANPPMPPATPSVCAAWAQLSATEADQLATRLRRADVRFSRSQTETPSSWWVRIAPQASQEQAEQRVRELRALGVQDHFIVQETGPNRHAVSLGVFQTEGRARQLLNQLRSRGVSNAELTPRMTIRVRIQAQLSPTALRNLESGQRALAARRVPCAKP